MGSGLFRRKRNRHGKIKETNIEAKINLTHAAIDATYEIKGIDTEDQVMKDFLFTLGCFEGEKITLISALADNYIIHIKDARYSIDSQLASVIRIGNTE
ncbi:ferrous iron transport protein A [Alkalibacter sp. M17DMB]|nr:ferrous iron transport protein A [Alkalibacter mobilis]